jgi:predicted nucleotidyltransferase
MGDAQLEPVVSQQLQRRLTESPPAGVIAVYLFGSHAEGRAHRESDLDVGVLLRWDTYPSARERFERRLRLPGELAVQRKTVDVIILNDAPPTLAARIVTEGQRLFCADSAAEHAFRRDVQLRAADLAPFLRRLSRVKLEGLGR